MHPSDTPEPAARSVASALTAWARHVGSARATPSSGRAHQLLLGVSSLVFVAAAVWAWRAESDLLSGLVWWPLVLSFFLAVPATFLLKAFEFDLAARILGHRPSLLTSFEIAVLSAAANLLPVPGGVIVTVRALSERGATYGQAVTSAAGVGVAWLGVSGVLGGGAIIVAGAPLVGIATVVAGVGGLVVSAVAIRSQAPTGHVARLFGAVVVLETAFVVVAAARLLLILVALDVDASAAQVVALTLANSLSVAVGFFPGGLGVRELLVAALSPLVGLSADIGLLTAVMDRVLWLTVMAVLTLAVLVARRLAPDNPSATPEPSREPT